MSVGNAFYKWEDSCAHPAFVPPLTTWRLGYTVGSHSLGGHRLGNMLEVQFINV